MSKKARVLIIDDERNTREGLKTALKNDYEVMATDSAQRGVDLVFERDYDVVLTDLRMPGMNGMDFIKRIQTMENPPACIMLTAYGSIETAVEAMKIGAYDFLTKPVNLDSLEMLLKRCLESRQLREENRTLKRELAARYTFEKMLGNSAAMEQVKETIRQFAPARSTVLLTGESGTGKELAARALHELGNRSARPFVAVHCAALATNLLETELFGHEKGAFTGANERRIGRFEAADGGTLFLDEIGEIDPSVQVTLLRILENRTFERVGGTTPIEVDVRLIAATNRDLSQMVQDGTFREDLYYRLDVLRVRMPPLREHREDIPLLVKHFVDEFAAENSREVDGLTAEALNALVDYHWPGNVRELRNCIERMVVMTRGKSITLKDVPASIRQANEEQDHRQAKPAVQTLDIEANEKQLIKQALDDCDGNRSAAARCLGISRRTLHRKLNQYDLRNL